MLSDRPYMRSRSGRPAPGFVVLALGAMVAVFVLQNIAQVWLRSGVIVTYGALYADALRSGWLWTLLTYALLHGSISHLLINGMAFYFLGKTLEDDLGAAKLARLTVIGALGAALTWAGVNFQRSGSVVGASGVTMAYLAVFACLHPRRPVTLLLFFVIPVTIQPIWMAIIFGGIDLVGFLFKELPHTSSLYGVAHSAHLGGLAAGWLFYKLAIERPASRETLNRSQSRPALRRLEVSSARSSPPTTGTTAGPVPVGTESMRAEVDRILDKINLQGFGSLTSQERQTLESARNHIPTR